MRRIDIPLEDFSSPAGSMPGFICFGQDGETITFSVYDVEGNSLATAAMYPWKARHMMEALQVMVEAATQANQTPTVIPIIKPDPKPRMSPNDRFAFWRNYVIEQKCCDSPEIQYSYAGYTFVCKSCGRLFPQETLPDV